MDLATPIEKIGMELLTVSALGGPGWCEWVVFRTGTGIVR